MCISFLNTFWNLRWFFIYSIDFLSTESHFYLQNCIFIYRIELLSTRHNSFQHATFLSTQVLVYPARLRCEARKAIKVCEIQAKSPCFWIFLWISSYFEFENYNSYLQSLNSLTSRWSNIFPRNLFYSEPPSIISAVECVMRRISFARLIFWSGWS